MIDGSDEKERKRMYKGEEKERDGKERKEEMCGERRTERSTVRFTISGVTLWPRCVFRVKEKARFHIPACTLLFSSYFFPVRGHARITRNCRLHSLFRNYPKKRRDEVSQV